MTGLTVHELYAYLREHRDVTTSIVDSVYDRTCWPASSARARVLGQMAVRYASTEALAYRAYCWAAFFHPLSDDELGRMLGPHGQYVTSGAIMAVAAALLDTGGYVSDHPQLLAELKYLEKFCTPPPIL